MYGDKNTKAPDFRSPRGTPDLCMAKATTRGAGDLSGWDRDRTSRVKWDLRSQRKRVESAERKATQGAVVPKGLKAQSEARAKQKAEAKEKPVFPLTTGRQEAQPLVASRDWRNDWNIKVLAFVSPCSSSNCRSAAILRLLGWANLP